MKIGRKDILGWFQWGLFSILLSGLFAPVWLELLNFASKLIQGREWTGLFGSLAPVLWIGLFIMVVVIFSIPQLIVTLTLGYLNCLFAHQKSIPMQSGLFIGIPLGILLGITEMLLGASLFFSEDQYTLEGLNDWLPLILWMIWTASLFGFISWRMSKRYLKSSTESLATDISQ
jgi:hypothetical protein